jgi:hypothetical protein
MLDSGFGYFRTRLCVTLCKHHFPMRSSVAPPATATVLSRCRDTQVYKVRYEMLVLLSLHPDLIAYPSQ